MLDHLETVLHGAGVAPVTAVKVLAILQPLRGDVVQSIGGGPVSLWWAGSALRVFVALPVVLLRRSPSSAPLLRWSAPPTG